ncbi:MAG TPA: hypothetical protein PLZ57_02745 [Pseudobdellovibrionaceae bacterium]|nr:hypothetical protein [Pseudobdellovibrionaceae bacterium]
MSKTVFEQKSWGQIWAESRPQDLWIVMDPVNSPWLARLDWELNLLIRRQWPRAEKGRLLVATPPSFPARGVLVLGVAELQDAKASAGPAGAPVGQAWETSLGQALADAKALGVERAFVLATSSMKPTAKSLSRHTGVEVMWVAP